MRVEYSVRAGWLVRDLQRLNLAHNRLATLPPSVSLLAELTVREMLMYTAELKRPVKVSHVLPI